MQQAALCLLDDGVHDRLAAVAGVSDQHAAGPVNPPVAPPILHERAVAALPDHRRHTLHGLRLVAAHFFQDRQRLRRRHLGPDAAETRGDFWNGDGCDVELWHGCPWFGVFNL